MRFGPLPLALLVIWAGCASLPIIEPVVEGEGPRNLASECSGLFASQPFRAIHAIDASLPMGNESSVLGVSLIDPAGRRFRAVLVSVEGLTLFDATLSQRGLDVHRAVPPLDEEGFGRGLVSDVALALLQPAAAPSQIGRMEDGRAVCRYVHADGRTTDVLPGPAGFVVIHYDRDERVDRKIRSTGSGSLGLPERQVLTAPGIAGYTLSLRLVEAGPVTLSEDLFRP